MTGDDSRNDGEHAISIGAERILPENSVEYMLFVVGEGQTLKPLARLEQLRKAAIRLSDRLTKDYIWQKDAFRLEIVSRKGLVYLYGTTEYGDSVEDEWLIVYMLRELSKSFPCVWARACDSDGEFLLVEAAKAVPRWLNPEIDAYRVWIHDGHLKVLPPAGVHARDTLRSMGASGPGLPCFITLADAIQAIHSTPELLLQLPDLEAEAFYRLGKYPAHIEASIHHARVVLPRKVAYILHDRPRAIAPAVEAFHYQDPTFMKRLFKPGRSEPFMFPPTDLVTVSVKFTRVLYAQLRAQRFSPPGSWSSEFSLYTAAAKEQRPVNKDKASGDKDKNCARDKIETMASLGMKIACGFELMAASAELNNNRIVREIGLVLEDLEEDGDGAAGALPTDDEITKWKDVDRDDDDSWLEIDFADLERELDRGVPTGHSEVAPPSISQTLEPGEPEEPSFRDTRMHTDLRKIVSRFQDFLNDNNAGIEGAQLDEMDDDDDDSGDDDGASSIGELAGIRFDEEEFARLMREMMGLPPSDEKEDAPSRTVPATAEPSVPKTQGGEKNDIPVYKSRTPASSVCHINGNDDDNGDDEQSILKLAAQFEEELQGYGALNLDDVTEGRGKQAVVQLENKGVSGHVSADTSTKGVLCTPIKMEGETEEDDDGAVDMDYNLARNLLESFKSQAGMAGPAGNILSMMGLSLPRDDDNDEDNGDLDSTGHSDGR